MVELLFGLYLMVVGVTGNAGGLLTELESDGAFIPFAAALAIIYFIWTDTPPPERKATHALIIALGGTVVITQYSRIISAVTTAWNTLQSLSPGNSVSSGISSSGASAAPAYANAFLSSIFPQAQATASALNVPVSAILGQAALETGWGTSQAATTQNNLFGINVAGAATGQNYQSYPTQNASIMGLQQLVQTQYPAAIGSTTPLQYGNALQSGGYATDPNYASKLNSTAMGSTIQNFLASQGL